MNNNTTATGLNPLIGEIPQGWECPRCKSVYSPITAKCWHCPVQSIQGTTTTSSTKMK